MIHRFGSHFHKFLLLSILFTFAFSPVLTAFAAPAEDAYYEFSFAKINTTIRVPKDFITFTRNVTSADPNLSVIGASADQMRVMFEKNDLYLETMPKDLSYEIVLGGKKGVNAPDYRTLSEEQLTEAFTAFKAQTDNNTIDTIYQYNIYRSADNVYFVVDFLTTTDVKVYTRKYFTIVEGCEVSVALQTKSPGIGDPNDVSAYQFDEQYAAQVLNTVNQLSFSQMNESLADSTIFQELLGYVLGIGITIGGLALILWLLIKTTSKPKNKSA